MRLVKVISKMTRDGHSEEAVIVSRYVRRRRRFQLGHHDIKGLEGCVVS